MFAPKRKRSPSPDAAAADRLYVASVTGDGRILVRPVARTDPDGSVTVLAAPDMPWPVAETLRWVAAEARRWHDATALRSTPDLREHWALRGDGVVARPGAHMHVAGDTTTVLAYVYRWRRATGFGAVQLSACGARAVLYLDDRVVRDETNFGTDIHHAVPSVQALRELLTEGLGAAAAAHADGNGAAEHVLRVAHELHAAGRLTFGVTEPRQRRTAAEGVTNA